MNLWQRLRGLLCPVLGHRYIADPHRKVCVYCWKQVRIRTFPDNDGPPEAP